MKKAKRAGCGGGTGRDGGRVKGRWGRRGWQGMTGDAGGSGEGGEGWGKRRRRGMTGEGGDAGGPPHPACANAPIRGGKTLRRGRKNVRGVFPGAPRRKTISSAEEKVFLCGRLPAVRKCPAFHIPARFNAQRRSRSRMPGRAPGRTASAPRPRRDGLRKKRLRHGWAQPLSALL